MVNSGGSDFPLNTSVLGPVETDWRLRLLLTVVDYFDAGGEMLVVRYGEHCHDGSLGAKVDS